MTRAFRWAAYGLGLIVGLIVVAAAAVWLISSAMLRTKNQAHSEQLMRPSAEQLADAPRQLHVRRCLDCHGDGLRGALLFDAPAIARVYAPNLTLIAAKATDEQLARAIRQGIGADGRALVAMPSATFSRLGSDEVAAMIAAIRALPQGGQVAPARQFGPLGRLGLATGKFHTQPHLVADYARKLPLDLGPGFAVGRHIAASNCAECHGPDLTGGEVEPGVIAPDLMIVGAYDPIAFSKLMRSGVPPSGRKLQLMSSIARDDFSHMTDIEIQSLYAYLQARAQHVGR